jgi:hypothetical protein
MCAIPDIPVDRREETVITRHPGCASTERVTRDVAAERRQGLDQFNQIMYTILGILVIGLGLRLALKLIAANASSGFAGSIYGITEPFVVPFVGLAGTPTSGGTILETATLIAMAVYRAVLLDRRSGHRHRYDPSYRPLKLAFGGRADC